MAAGRCGIPLSYRPVRRLPTGGWVDVLMPVAMRVHSMGCEWGPPGVEGESWWGAGGGKEGLAEGRTGVP